MFATRHNEGTTRVSTRVTFFGGIDGDSTVLVLGRVVVVRSANLCSVKGDDVLNDTRKQPVH